MHRLIAAILVWPLVLGAAPGAWAMRAASDQLVPRSSAQEPKTREELNARFGYNATSSEGIITHRLNEVERRVVESVAGTLALQATLGRILIGDLSREEAKPAVMMVLAQTGTPNASEEASRLLSALFREAERAGLRVPRGGSTTDEEDSLARAREQAEAEATFVSNRPAQVTPTIARRAATAAAVVLAARYRGTAAPGNKESIKAVGKKADAEAKRVYQAVLADAGYRLLARGPEGIGRDGLSSQEAFKVAELVNGRGLGPTVSGLVDVLEVTKQLGSNNEGVARANLDPANAGSTSLFVQGPEQDSLGNISDDAYMDGLFFHVRPENRQQFVDDPIRPDTEDYMTIKRALERIASANGVTVNEVDVSVLDRPRERARLAVFRRVQEEYPDMTISTYPDGTVNHNLLAGAGLKHDGRVKVSWTVGAPVETASNLKLVKALRSRGAVGGAVVYSVNVASIPIGLESEQGEATDLSRRYDFSEQDEHDWVQFQGAERARQILVDHKLWTDADIAEDVHASIPIVTDSAALGSPGVEDLDDGRFRVTSVNVQQEGDGKGHLWVDVEDVSIAEIDRIVARGTFALNEPAAADLSVVDPDGNLLALMESSTPQTVLISPEIAAQTPGFFIVWERALQRFADAHQLASLDEAARQSALKVVVQTYTDLSNVPQGSVLLSGITFMPLSASASGKEESVDKGTITLQLSRADAVDLSVENALLTAYARLQTIDGTERTVVAIDVLAGKLPAVIVPTLGLHGNEVLPFIERGILASRWLEELSASQARARLATLRSSLLGEAFEEATSAAERLLEQFDDELAKAQAPSSIGSKRVTELVEAINKASGGATQLQPAWFGVVDGTPAEALQRAAQVAGAPVTLTIGPRGWLEAIRAAAPAEAVPVQVAVASSADDATAIRSPAAALVVGVAALASDDKRPPEAVAKRLDVDISDAAIIEVNIEPVETTVGADVQAYQANVRQAVRNI